MMDVYGLQITEQYEDLHEASFNIVASYQQEIHVNTFEVL
jgi:2-iminoacetate synthase ThiH